VKEKGGLFTKKKNAEILINKEFQHLSKLIEAT